MSKTQLAAAKPASSKAAVVNHAPTVREAADALVAESTKQAATAVAKQPPSAKCCGDTAASIVNTAITISVTALSKTAQALVQNNNDLTPEEKEAALAGITLSANVISATGHAVVDVAHAHITLGSMMTQAGAHVDHLNTPVPTDVKLAGVSEHTE